MHDPAPDPRLRCPLDATLMDKDSAGGPTVDRCARCGAIWLDRGELERIIAKHGAAAKLDLGPSGHLAPGALLGQVLCPRDGSVLAEMPDPRQPHVRLLVCPSCKGALLDAGELADLSDFTLLEKLRSFMG